MHQDQQTQDPEIQHQLMMIRKTLMLLDDEKSERLIKTSYEHFFTLNPAAEDLWEGDGATAKGKMFNNIILTVMDNLVRPEIVEGHLASEAADHKGYGTSNDMYAQFFQAVIAAFTVVLGDEFDAEMQQVWQRQFDQLEGITCKHAKT